MWPILSTELMTIGQRLRNSYKLKLAARLAREALSWPALLYWRMILQRQMREMPVLRVHLGCGHINDPRFLNVDARRLPHVHYVSRSLLMRALPEGSADMIYACHVFEHISHRTQMPVLQRWLALLKPGGELRLSVPDFEKLIDHFGNKRFGFHQVELVLMGGQGYPENFHQALFTADHLNKLLTKAGFTNIRHWRAEDQENWPKDWSWDERVSLNMTAQKP
jgi:predicted SAM-dependent methyltransferase